MKLTFRKHEVKNLAHLQTLVTENAEAIEPSFSIIAQTLNLGRSTVDLAGLDSHHTPVLIALGFIADDQMLFRMLEAYAWCLEYPDSIRRLVPAGGEPAGWPPRVVFVGERVIESFLRKIGLLNFPAVDCFEFRCVEVNGATGFYLDAVDWTKGSSAASDGHAAHPAPVAHAIAARDQGPPAGLRVSLPLAQAAVLERQEERVDEPRESTSRQRGVAPTNGPNGAGERAETPRWLDLLATSVELGGVKVAAAPDPTRQREADEPAKIEVAEDLNAPDRAAALEGIELPQNRDLAPTWRKFLEKLAGTFESRVVPESEDAPAPAAPAPDAQPPAAPVAAASLQAVPSGTGADSITVVSPADESADRPRMLLDGVTLPANGELAPQWRKFLDKPPIDDAKIGLVREYLHREFPHCTIYDFHEFQRGAQVFQLQDNHGKVSQLATIEADFFDARHDSEIRPWLERHKLAQALRQAGQIGVFVTPAGIQIEKR